MLAAGTVSGDREAVSARVGAGSVQPTLAEVDGWLEAALTGGMPVGWRTAVAEAAPGPHMADDVDRWRRLLLAEGALAEGDAAAGLDVIFKSLASKPGAASSDAGRRIASRAAAALVRLRVAQGSGLWDVLDWAAFAALPAWERLYLRGWVEWRDGNLGAAEQALRGSLAEDAGRGYVRLALATLRSRQSPDEALTLIEPAQPTFDVLVSRAALLLRLRREDEAQFILAQTRPPARLAREPLRYDSARAHVERDRQCVLLLAGLAERQGRWLEARSLLRSPVLAGGRAGAIDARLAFSAGQELRRSSGNRPWVREEAGQLVRRHLSVAASAPLGGDDLFHRGWARLAVDPASGLADLRSLRQQAGWVASQQRLGGRRLVAIGDALLGLGNVTEAVRAYETAGPACPEAAERLEFARLALALTGTGAAAKPGPSAPSAEDSIVRNPWLCALRALHMAMAGETGPALAGLAQVRRSAKPDLGGILPGDWTVTVAAGSVGSRSAAASELSRGALDAALRLVFGPEKSGERAAAFIAFLGEKWVDYCPTAAEAVARLYLAGLCARAKWAEAATWVRGLVSRGLPWAADMAALVDVQRGLAAAVAGDFDQAKSLLGPWVRAVDRKGERS
jgi:hypothetical protein